MMFLKYRIRRAQEKADIQKAYVTKLEIIADDYGYSYYTDQLLQEHRRWLELNSKLMWLKANYEKNSKL